jgi:hypothetical protein
MGAQTMMAPILRIFRTFVGREGYFSYLSYLRSGYHAYIFRIFRNSSYFTKILYFVFFVIPLWPEGYYGDEHTKNTNNSETSIDSQAIPSVLKIAHGQARLRRIEKSFTGIHRRATFFSTPDKNKFSKSQQAIESTSVISRRPSGNRPVVVPVAAQIIREIEAQ